MTWICFVDRTSPNFDEHQKKGLEKSKIYRCWQTVWRLVSDELTKEWNLIELVLEVMLGKGAQHRNHLGHKHAQIDDGHVTADIDVALTLFAHAHAVGFVQEAHSHAALLSVGPVLVYSFLRVVIGHYFSPQDAAFSGQRLASYTCLYHCDKHRNWQSVTLFV